MLTGTPATPEQYNSLLATLGYAEQKLDEYHSVAAADLAEDVMRRPRREQVQFVRQGVIYALELTGFEAISHPTLGLVVEYIGYFPRAERRVLLGVSEQEMRTRYLKLG